MKTKHAFFSALLMVVSGTVFSDNVIFYDAVPSVEEMQRQLLGYSKSLPSVPKKRLTRSFQVDDDTQQISNPQEGDNSNIQSTRIIIKDRAVNNTQNVNSGESTRQLPAEAPPTPVLAFPINFDVGSAQLRSESLKFLDAIAKLINNNNVALMIEGHTDISGNSVSNFHLSRERAYAVVNYLVDMYGVNPAKLSAMGLGSKQPLNGEAPTSDKNRRVQIRVRPS